MIRALLIVPMILAFASASQATMIIESADIEASATTAGACCVLNKWVDKSTPTLMGVTDVSAGNAESNANANLILSDDGFVQSFDLQRGNDIGSDAVVTFVLTFYVDVPTEYSFTGSMNTVDPQGGIVGFKGVLWDGSYNSSRQPRRLYNSTQESTQTADESFILGQLGGDLSNVLLGDSTGLLEVGTLYMFEGEVTLRTFNPLATGGATGFGQITMELTQVPEPNTALLLGLGLLGLAWRRVRN